MYINYIEKNIYGNAELSALFTKEIASAHLAHAYIIEGLKGSGKYTFVLSLLATLAASERNSSLILDGMCADIMTVYPEEGKKTIGVNAVRSIREGAYIKPTDLDFKAYIIRYADIMTPQAQNALLKLLEEPPSNVYFFLLCENSAFLLPTVRSRAPVVRMQLFSEDELKRYLLSVSDKRGAFARKSESELEHIICQSGGAIGACLPYADIGTEESDKTAEKVISLLEFLADKKKIGLYKLINDRYLKREDMAAITEGIQLAVRDVIVAKQKGKKEMLFGYRDKITPLARRLTFSQLVSCYDAATKASDALAQNMNVAAVKATLSNDLWKTVL